MVKSNSWACPGLSCTQCSCPNLGGALRNETKEAAYFRVCCKSRNVSCPTISTASAEFPFERRATFYRKKSVWPFYENVAKNLKRIWLIFLLKVVENMKFNNDKCPEPQPLGFSGLSQKKKGGGGGWEKALVSASHVSPRNRRRNLTARDLRRPLKYFMSNE